MQNPDHEGRGVAMNFHDEASTASTVTVAPPAIPSPRTRIRAANLKKVGCAECGGPGWQHLDDCPRTTEPNTKTACPLHFICKSWGGTEIALQAEANEGRCPCFGMAADR